jgi:hypothetical protein
MEQLTNSNNNSKMKETIESKKFINQVDEIYQKALVETIELLKKCSKGKYIAIPNWEDEVNTIAYEDVPINIWGVGLNDKDHICIKAFVDNVGYGHSDDDFPDDWTDITEDEIRTWSYPHLYRFVADNIDAATDKETADNVEWE